MIEIQEYFVSNVRYALVIGWMDGDESIQDFKMRNTRGERGRAKE